MLLWAPKVEAIVILPALLLIPIAKIVAIVIGILSVPSLTLGVITSKLFKHSVKRTIGIVLLVLVVLALVVAVALKLENPMRPWFSL